MILSYSFELLLQFEIRVIVVQCPLSAEPPDPLVPVRATSLKRKESCTMPPPPRPTQKFRSIPLVAVSQIYLADIEREEPGVDDESLR